MSEFKTEICQDLNHKSNEEQLSCMNYHISDGRRKLFGKNKSLTHSTNKCENIDCKDINCVFAHNELEILYHPLKYKTEACKSMTHIKVRIFKQNNLPLTQFPQSLMEAYMVCPFFHDEITD